VGYCSTRAQVRHAAHVLFPVDFDGGEHVSVGAPSTIFVPPLILRIVHRFKGERVIYLCTLYVCGFYEIK